MAGVTDKSTREPSQPDEVESPPHPRDRRAAPEPAAALPRRRLTRWTWLRGQTPDYAAQLEQWEVFAKSDMMSQLGKALKMGDRITIEYDIDRDDAAGKITVILFYSGLTADAIEERIRH